ncbi:Rho GTPase-activating protein 9 [Entophlyctis luteolus]|nr:Rho GTPase-activating protein 9 [Entophlyctis luteolus]
MPSTLRARALWDYQALEDNELSFVAGDIVTVLDLCNDDWYEGTVDGAIVGYFPANRVALLDNIAAISGESNVLDSSLLAQEAIDASAKRRESVGSTKRQAPKPPPSRRSIGDLQDLQLSNQLAQVQTPTPSIVAEAPVQKTVLAEALATPPRDPFRDEGSDSVATTPPKAFESDNFVAQPASHRNAVEDASKTAETDSNPPTEADVLVPDGWKLMKDSDDRTFYWNEKANKASWQPPSLPNDQLTPEIVDFQEAGVHSESLTASAHVSEAELSGFMQMTSATVPIIDDAAKSPAWEKIELDLTAFEHLPTDLVWKEGGLRYKVSTKGEPKHNMLASSWKLCHAAVCIGILFLFKEAPGKGKKLIPPFDALILSNFTVDVVGKDYTSKKHAFMYTSVNGEHRIFMTDSESTTVQWITAIKECGMDRHTEAEYQAVISRVFHKQKPSPNFISAPISDPIPITSWPTGANNEKLRLDALPKETSVGAAAPRKSVFSGNAKDRQSDGSIGVKFPFFGKKPGSKSATDVAVRLDQPFGGFLDAQLETEKTKIPRVVEMCIAAVESRSGMEVQGIYRLSGNSATVNKLKAAFNHGENVDLSAESDINVITGLLKSYFRELQNPLIPFEFYDQFIASSKLEDYNERLIQLKNLIQALPKSNYDVLSYLLHHLRRVSEKSEINKMEQANLAIVFAPTLIRVPEGNGDASSLQQQGYMSIANMPFHNKLIESMLEQQESTSAARAEGQRGGAVQEGDIELVDAACVQLASRISPKSLLQRPMVDAPSCVSIADTSVCSPLSVGFSIDMTSLADFYDFSSSVPGEDLQYWETQVAITSETHTEDTFLSQYGCTAPNASSSAPTIKLLRSYLCVRDILVLSAGCNSTAPASVETLCTSICTEWADSVDAALSNSTRCGSVAANYTSQVESDASKCSAAISQAFLSYSVSSSPLSTSSRAAESCALGVAHDLAIQVQETTSVNGSVVSVDTSGTTLGTPAIIGIVAGCLILLAVLGMCVFLRLRRRAKPSHRQSLGIYSQLHDSDYAFEGANVSLMPLKRTETVLSSVPLPDTRSGYVELTPGNPQITSSNSTTPLIATSEIVTTAEVPASPAKKGFKIQRKVITTTTTTTTTTAKPATPPQYAVNHSYTASRDDELDLAVGDVVVIEERLENAWARGRNLTTGKTGLFPAACLE